MEPKGRGWGQDGQLGIEMDPGNALDEIGEILELQGFYEEGMGAEFVGAVHDFDVRFTGQDDNAEGLMGRILAQPFQNVPTAFSRHVEIEEQQNGERILAAIGVNSLAAQIGECFFSVIHFLEGV